MYTVELSNLFYFQRCVLRQEYANRKNVKFTLKFIVKVSVKYIYFLVAGKSPSFQRKYSSPCYFSEYAQQSACS